MNEKLLLGKNEAGEEFFVEPFHTLLAGQTNLSGKTTTAIALANEAVRQGYTVLFFDTKPTGREFEGYHDIPICYQPTTDPLVLIGLLEAKRKAKLSPLYATLGRISQRAKNIADIIKNAERMEQRVKSGFVKDACWTLADLLKRIDSELHTVELSTKLELKNGVINVMPFNNLSDEAQQLVLKTALDQVLRHHNKQMIVLVDEAFRFFPEEFSSACKREGITLITQGARTGCYVWISTQFLATTDKSVIKACANKLLGRQDDPTEIEATQKRIPRGKQVISADELMTLKRGEFVFVPLDGKSLKVKVIPPWERSYKPSGYEYPKQDTLSDSMHDSFIERSDELSDRLEKLGF